MSLGIHYQLKSISGSLRIQIWHNIYYTVFTQCRLLNQIAYFQPKKGHMFKTSFVENLN